MAEQPVSPEITEELNVLTEITDKDHKGSYTGQCKWFNDKLGYGFITICDGADKGKDIFTHHSGIKPLNSNYKTLKKGEYINFNIVQGVNGLQAVDITGICGGPLMCDIIHGMQQPTTSNREGWQTIPQRRDNVRGSGGGPRRLPNVKYLRKPAPISSSA